MKFRFDKPQCQNIRKAIRKEWILTNGLGSYASSTILSCNTRKYHGLLTLNLAEPPGRFVLLSTLEEFICAEGKEFNFSSRQHPDVYYPKGYKYLESVDVSEWPIFDYKLGPLLIRREVIMPYNRNITLFRYTAYISEACPPLSLKINPLLAFRDMHTLTYENYDINTVTQDIPHGFMIQPYKSLPPLYMYAEGSKGIRFTREPDWYKNICYLVEEERGFNNQEDLFKAGSFEIALEINKPVYLAASSEPISESLVDLWEAECARRHEINVKSKTLLEHLNYRVNNFISRSPQNHLELVAGYPWFQAWGRDTLIALPGTTFATGRIEEGKEILAAMAKHLKNGLIPNMFSPDGNNSYNTIDASLWFVWAVQFLEMYTKNKDEESTELEFIKEVCYPAINEIINSYKNNVNNALPHVFVNKDGLLYFGDERTQLTWMDAHAYGKPVTPRFGYAVEINALWYNARAYLKVLAEKFNGELEANDDDLRLMREAFRKKFWVEEEYVGYLADSKNHREFFTSIRPNQIFAVSLPYSVLDESDWPSVVETVRSHLLTPYGLRTLSPRCEEYKASYKGDSDERDSAYHQGTVWPWLLGAYTDALLRTAWDVDSAVYYLLETLKPLFSEHLADAGLGTISEIFDADPPYLPNGCISQAWSVAECFRLLQNLQKASPKIFSQWEKQIGSEFV